MSYRKLGTGLCLLLPALAWTACSSDDDSAPVAGGGEAGASAGKGGSATAGKSGVSGSGNKAGSSNESAGTTSEGGAPGEAGAKGEAGSGEEAGAGEAGAPAVGDLNTEIDNIVVIYAENRSFDGLFGNFPGAHGLSEVLNADGTPNTNYIKQKDRDGTTVLPKLPQTWGGATAAGNATTVAQILTDNLPNSPFGIENAFVANGAPALTTTDVTRDLTHRFFENIMEINGGTNDMFAAWLDAGGLTMGHWDYSQSGMYKLAQENVVADNFFEGAFGGSFLNHQYLICGCAPKISASVVANYPTQVTTLGAANSKGVPQLALDPTSPASALTNFPKFANSTFIAPLDYFGDGDGYRGINTMQPAYQPSFNSPPATATAKPDLLYANPVPANTLEPQTQTTIGDTMTAKNVDWAWYATSWDAAVADGTQVSTAPRTVLYAPSGPRSAPDFQTHHHPFNFYAAFDPVTHAADRTAHLKDYNAMLTQIQAGTLPAVSFYKPTGNVNQHPGYANIDDADQHITALVDKLKAGPQWAHMVIVITYDEYGGQWDHVAPPKGDLLGPGTRIPAIIISPYAKKGTVDHTQYDTGSIARLITRRFGLTALPGITSRDNALVTAGGVKMGDLTAALNVK